MAKDCKDNEQIIIDLLRGVNSSSGDFRLYFNNKLTVENVQQFLIDKVYNTDDHITPFFVNILKKHPNKDLLPCFILNKDTFKITGFYDSNDNLITELWNFAKSIRYKFTYGTSSTVWSMESGKSFYASGDPVPNDETNDKYDISLMTGYPPSWFSSLINNTNVTFQNLYELFNSKSFFKNFLFDRGVKYQGIEENVDYKLQWKVRGKGQDENPSNWNLITDLNTLIWNSNWLQKDPFKRDNIQICITLFGNVGGLPNSHLVWTCDLLFTIYQKIQLDTYNWPKLEFNARSLHDKYQQVIDLVNSLIYPIFPNEIKKLKDENFWIFNNDYPEFNWNFGANFIEAINGNLDQFDIITSIVDPNAEITKDEIATWTIKAKPSSTAFYNQIILQCPIKTFVRYKLEEVAFAIYNYQAKTIYDTYRDALNTIKTEIRNVLVRNFNEERITENDFTLSTENEDTVIKQDKTIDVIIKATNDSEWLSGQSKFQLNVKQLIIFKPFRQFKLINNLQQEINLQDLNLVIGSNPNDLGINYKNDFLQIENNFIFTQKNSGLNNINFNLTFLAPNAYDKYYSFIEFLISNINTNQALTLTYKIFYNNQNFNKDYNCEIFFKGINKTELNNLGNLEVQINFEKVSNWKNLIIKQIEFESNILELENNGQLPAPTMIQIFGSSKNPYFILKNEKNEILAESKINYSFENSDILTIDAKVTEQKIIVKRNNQEINIFDKQDFTKKTFIFIPPGKSKLVYQNEKGSERIYVSFEEQYLSI